MAPDGTATLDYSCPECGSPFQLKSQSKPFGAKILDSAYSQMKRAILTDRTPNLYVLHYDLAAWAVRTVILVPHFAFALSAIEVRPPLAPTARRAGWIGCNILLHKIPADARIAIVDEGRIRPAAEVRRAYKRLRPLEKIKAEKRGWTLDVLNVVRALVEKREAGRAEAVAAKSRHGEMQECRPKGTALHNTFTLGEVYAHAEELGKLHPRNRHIEPKIRQQLQVLRDDLGLIEFLTPGQYRLR